MECFFVPVGCGIPSEQGVVQVKQKWIKGVVMLAVSALILSACFGQKSPDQTAVESGDGNGNADRAAGDRANPEIPYLAPETVAEGLQVPWDIAFAPDGRLFLTERVGFVRVIEGGRLVKEPVADLSSPPFASRGESGLLGIALDPEFSKNGYAYVYHTYRENGQMLNRVVRLVIEGNKGKIDKVLLDQLPGHSNHDGGRLRFGPDGMLYITVGDALDPMLSQNVESLAGKILRIRPDGTIPDDNPFAGSPVYSLGHRNPQGLAWHPDSRILYSSEHGQSAKDEINRIEKGRNYGWPLIEGDESRPSQPAALQTELQRPLLHSGSVTWAPSGMTFVTQGPWNRKLLVANLRGQQVLMLTLSDSGMIEDVQALWHGAFGRIRSVEEGPAGSLYLLTNNRDGRGVPQPGDDRLLRLKPIL